MALAYTKPTLEMRDPRQIDPEKRIDAPMSDAEKAAYRQRTQEALAEAARKLWPAPEPGTANHALPAPHEQR